MAHSTSKKTVLAIGGLDPTGAAGTLLDVAAIRSVGFHGAAVNAISTVQDGKRFISSKSASAPEVHSAIKRVMQNLNVYAVKTGALGGSELVEMVALLAAEPGFPPLVVDPVFRSSTGGVLLDERGVASLRDVLLPKVSLVTPNLSEAADLTGLEITDLADMKEAAKQIVELGAKAVLIKGGHLKGNELHDVFLDNAGLEQVFVGKKIGSADVRGTGCALASLIAANIGTGLKIIDAVEQARNLLRTAIQHARPIDNGPSVLSFGDYPGQ
jgi:hydroxymethylpyrimidine/phosphomethylpyrimidine kinase